MATSTRIKLTRNTVKRWLASIADAVGLCRAGLILQKRLYGPYIRVVNCHVVKPSEIQNFRRQLEFYSRNFASVTPKDLKNFIDDGVWSNKQPGILLTFDDGTRDHLDIVAPQLEEFGFTGWFFVPTGRIESDATEVADRGENLTSTEIRRLAEKHVIGSHGVDHVRLSREVPADTLVNEIATSRDHLRSILGYDVEAFCWVGGEDWAYSEEAADLVRGNYKYGFMGNSDVILPGCDPFQLSRSNVEAENPMALVRFQLSGIVDLYFTSRRRRVLRVTKPRKAV